MEYSASFQISDYLCTMNQKNDADKKFHPKNLTDMGATEEAPIYYLGNDWPDHRVLYQGRLV